MCKCAGNYGNTWMSRESLVDELEVFKVVAEKNQMSLLAAQIKEMQLIK